MWGYSIYCKGCNQTHDIPTVGPDRPLWGTNDNKDQPTFTPSLLVRTGKYVDPDYQEDPDMLATGFGSRVCHSFITNGNIQYLSDCTHALAGQTIPLPEYSTEEERWLI